jgi:hypothetical protein
MGAGVGINIVACMIEQMDDRDQPGPGPGPGQWENRSRDSTGKDPKIESGGPVFVIVAGRQTWGLIDVPSDGTNRHSITASICMHVSYLTLLAVCHHVCLCVGSTIRLAPRAVNGMLPLVQGLQPWRKRIFSTMHFADLESGPESPHCNDWPESLGYY